MEVPAFLAELLPVSQYFCFLLVGNFWILKRAWLHRKPWDAHQILKFSCLLHQTQMLCRNQRKCWHSWPHGEWEPPSQFAWDYGVTQDDWLLRLKLGWLGYSFLRWTGKLVGNSFYLNLYNKNLLQMSTRVGFGALPSASTILGVQFYLYYFLLGKWPTSLSLSPLIYNTGMMLRTVSVWWLWEWNDIMCVRYWAQGDVEFSSWVEL